MKFRYEAEMCQVADCPPSDAVSRDIEAFRFVYEYPDDYRNFLCVYKITPSRVLPSAKIQCGGYGLSFFASKEDAIKKYERLKTIKNINKTIGNKLAVVPIKQSDGLMSKPNESGHFDLWEADAIDFSSRFQIVADLSP